MEGALQGGVGNRFDLLNNNDGGSATAYLSRELFEAVASRNHEALLRVYATNARASLLRYASAKSRWNSWIPHPPQHQQSRSSSARLRKQERQPTTQDHAWDDDLVWTARLRQDYDNTGSDISSMRVLSSELRGRSRPNEIEEEEEEEEEDNVSDDADNLSYAAETAVTAASSFFSGGAAPSLAASSGSSSTASSTTAASSPLSFSFLSFRPTLSQSSSSSPPPPPTTFPSARQQRAQGEVNDESASYYRLLKELAQLVSDRGTRILEEGAKKPPKIEVSVETERLLRDSASMLSEARPPHDLVVPAASSSVTARRGFGGGNSISHAGEEDPQLSPGRLPGSTTMNNDRPPVFDGGVALATPPPMTAAGPGAGMMGGAGTILHLACAVDSPLALAFLLAMGGNPHATHTAFRRMMVHEAACNGSYQCLTLLLELGQEFASLSSATADSSKAPLAEAAGALSSSSSLMGQLDLPFLPRRMDRSEALAPLQLYLRPFHNQQDQNQQSPSLASSGFAPPPFLQRTAAASAASISPFAATCSDKESISTLGADFVSVLHLFRECYSQVEEGAISELEAARKVVATACLNANSKATLATSCGFLPAATASSPVAEDGAPTSYRQVSNSFLWRTRPAVASRSPSSGPSSRGLNGASADGHGNTPLHWAAFKNEVDCVRLLLKYRANPNARASPSGWTPLHDAAYSNSVETIALLLDAGANVDARANSGATPLCFAAQEDAARAAGLLLERGADLTARCAGTPSRPGDDAGSPHGRFSGYTPLHYCAHYNAHRAARVLLQHPTARKAMEIADLSDRLPIHVAVARGSADVLRELLHAGARVETRAFPSSSPSPASGSASASRRRRLRSENGPLAASSSAASGHGGTDPGSAPSTPTRQRLRPLPPTPERRTVTPRSRPGSRAGASSGGGATSVGGVGGSSSTPVSSPVLRSMIPAQPVTSSKPWNCLTQRSIDECRTLISEAEQSWAPDRHELFTPEDRRAVMELLRVGKRLELQGTGIHVQALWPTVLSFCGRGWFQAEDGGSDDATSIRDDNSDACEATSDGELDFVADAAPSVDTSDESLTLPSF